MSATSSVFLGSPSITSTIMEVATPSIIVGLVNSLVYKFYYKGEYLSKGNLYDSGMITIGAALGFSSRGYMRAFGNQIATIGSAAVCGGAYALLRKTMAGAEFYPEYFGRDMAYGGAIFLGTELIYDPVMNVTNKYLFRTGYSGNNNLSPAYGGNQYTENNAYSTAQISPVQAYNLSKKVGRR